MSTLANQLNEAAVGAAPEEPSAPGLETNDGVYLYWLPEN